MNLYFSLASSFATGCVYALSGRGKITAGEFMGRWVLAALVFHSVVFTPSFLYAVVFYPDWSVMYFFEPLALRPFAWVGWLYSAGALVLSFGLLLAGFSYGRKRVLGGNGPSAVTIVTFIYVVAAVVMVILYRRTLFLGTLSQYHGSGTRFLFSRPLGFVLAWYLLMIPASIWFWKRLFARKPSHL